MAHDLNYDIGFCFKLNIVGKVISGLHSGEAAGQCERFIRGLLVVVVKDYFTLIVVGIHR